MVRFVGYRLSRDIFSKCVELLDQARFFQLEIGIASSNTEAPTADSKLCLELSLAIFLREGVSFIITDKVSGSVEFVGICVDVFLLDMVRAHDRRDKFLESTRNDPCGFRIFPKEFLVSAEGFGNFLLQVCDELVQMLTISLQ